MVFSSPKKWAAILGLVVFFLIVTYLSRHYIDALQNFVEQEPVWGILIYLAFMIFDVLVPGSVLPLIPASGRIWGPWTASLLTIAGWTWGSLVAFFLAHRYGRPVISHIVSDEQVDRIGKHIPHNLFWGVVLLRLVFPLDVVSYALGLFTHMGYRSYLIASAIGVAPVAISLTFIGTLPPLYEIVIFASGAVIFLWLIHKLFIPNS